MHIVKTSEEWLNIFREADQIMANGNNFKQWLISQGMAASTYYKYRRKLLGKPESIKCDFVAVDVATSTPETNIPFSINGFAFEIKQSDLPRFLKGIKNA